MPFLGIKVADINIAEGQKRARILASEAFKTEQVNQALGVYYVSVVNVGPVMTYTRS